MSDDEYLHDLERAVKELSLVCEAAQYADCQEGSCSGMWGKLEDHVLGDVRLKTAIRRALNNAS